MSFSVHFFLLLFFLQLKSYKPVSNTNQVTFLDHLPIFLIYILASKACQPLIERNVLEKSLNTLLPLC